MDIGVNEVLVVMVVSIGISIPILHMSKLG